MKKYILSIGLNDKDLKVQKISTVEAYKVVENTLINQKIEGFTIYEAFGVYTHEDKTITKERTLRVEIYDFSEGKNDEVLTRILASVKILKQVLNQESIAFEVQKTDSELL